MLTAGNPISTDHEVRTFTTFVRGEPVVNTFEVRVERHYQRPAFSWFKGGGYLRTEYKLEWYKSGGVLQVFDNVTLNEMVTCVTCQKTIGRHYLGVVVEKLTSRQED